MKVGLTCAEEINKTSEEDRQQEKFKKKTIELSDNQNQDARISTYFTNCPSAHLRGREHKPAARAQTSCWWSEQSLKVPVSPSSKVIVY